MSRTFKVEGTRRVTEYVTYWVTADDFDDARSRVYDGDYDDYDVTDSDWDSCCDDIDDVTCGECDECESYCGCDEDNDVDETDNPDWSKGVAPFDLCCDEWYVADEYTYNYGFRESSPVKVTSVGSKDDDGEYRVRFERSDGSEDYHYVNAAARFEHIEVDDDTEIEDVVADREREARTQQALDALLRV